MALVESKPSGVEEWSCATCGRRFVVQWTPTYEKVVLDPGEKHVPHFGAIGGLRIGRVNAIPPEAPDVPEPDEVDDDRVD